ncbi:MAG: potassium channel family protein, partial [Pseudomonadota bacterium]
MDLRGKIRLGLLAIVCVLAFGTVGYRLLVGWPWFRCVYMTVITLSTIGYGEMPGMTETARYFTVVVIIMGVSTVGYTISVLTQYIIQSEILSLSGRRRVLKLAAKLHNHYIICGAGRVGAQVAHEMVAAGARFIVIEKDAQVAEQLLQKDYLVLVGDATREETLKVAGIHSARGIVCAASSDADNVYTSLVARDLNPKIQIVARANEEAAESKMLKAGA